MFLIDKLPARIYIGNEGEENATQVRFDVSAWDALYPDAVYSITYVRPGETTVYPEVPSHVVHADGVLTWTPSESVLDISDYGTAVINCTEDDVKKKSVMTMFFVARSHPSSGAAPDPIADWIADATSKLAEVDHIVDETIAATEAANEAAGLTTDAISRANEISETMEGIAPLWADVGISVSALGEGAAPTASIAQDETGTSISLGIPKGDTGTKGDKGNDGKPFTYRGDYNAGADPLYSKNDVVRFGGGSFVYINDVDSNEPTTSTSHWQQIASVGGQDLVDAAVAAKNTAVSAKDTAVAAAATLVGTVANGLTAKGASAYASLPTTGNEIGDYYYCSDGSPAGNYVWNGTVWYFGGTGDEGYSNLKSDLKETNIQLKDGICTTYPFRNANLGNNKVYSGNSESSLFRIIKGNKYKWFSDGNRNTIGYFYSVPTVGESTYDNNLYSIDKNEEFVAPIIGYCMVYHNNAVSDSVSESFVATMVDNIKESTAQIIALGNENFEIITELNNQVATRLSKKIRYSGYVLVDGKLKTSYSESVCFRVFKGWEYNLASGGNRNNYAFFETIPKENDYCYDGIKEFIDTFISPINGYCVHYINNTVSDDAYNNSYCSVLNTKEELILNDNGIYNLDPERIYLNENQNIKYKVEQQGFGLSFVFSSDIHIRNEKELYKMDIIKHCGKFADGIILNGDIINGGTKEIATDLLIRTIERARNNVSEVYPVVGNHDTNLYYSNGSTNVEKMINNLMFSNLTLKGLIKPIFDSNHPTQVYYYVDFPLYKVRMIILNTSSVWNDDGSGNITGSVFGFKNEQLNWLGTKALDFSNKNDSEDWGVILFMHQSLINDDVVEKFNIDTCIIVTNLLNAYKTGGTYTINGVTYDFTNQGAREIIACFTGHTHYDVVSTNNMLNVPIISISCGMASQSTTDCVVQEEDTPMTTKSAPVRSYIYGNLLTECFDVVKVDRINRKIICNRYGAGNSREIDY